MNVCSFTGRLVRDVEARSTASGMVVANYTIAVDKDRTVQEGEQKADFFRMVAYDKAAEWAKRWLAKGVKVEVVCRAQQRNYEDKTGVKREVVEFVVQRQGFAESKAARDGAATLEAPQAQPQAAPSKWVQDDAVLFAGTPFAL